MRTPAIPGAKLALRVVMIALFVAFPFACALVAVAYAPPAHIEVAGQTVSVKPVLGQDTSRLLDGALVRPDHAHVDVIGKNIGVDVDADWNRLIPSDKRTRAYLTALWEDPTPQIGRIQDAARRHVLFWSGAGFLAGAVVVVGVWSGLAYRRHRLRGYPPEQADLVRRHNRRLRGVLAVVGTAALVAVDVVGARVFLRDDHHTVISSPVFAGTSLEGTEVNGLAAEVLPFLSILRPRSTFYDTVADNLERAIAQRPSAATFRRRGRPGARGGLRGRERDGPAGGSRGRPRRRELPRPHRRPDLRRPRRSRPTSSTPSTTTPTTVRSTSPPGCTTPRWSSRRPRRVAGTSLTARPSTPRA